MKHRPASWFAARSIGPALARTRRTLQTLARGLGDALEAGRDARDAEALHHGLSRLSDAELARRGTDRRGVVRLVFERLTVGQEPASRPMPRGYGRTTQGKSNEETMNRSAALASLLLCFLVPSTAMCGPSAKEMEVNGVRLSYVEQGSGEPVVFVHGAFSDLRVWEPMRERIAQRYRFIAYTQRYFGTGTWPDDGQNFSVATDADDLGKFITALNVGPVHLVSRSRGGPIATAAALKNPSLVRSLTLHEPALLSVLPAESEEGKAAREDRKKFVGPAVAAAARAGDSVQAVRLFFEGVYQLGEGGFGRLPQTTRAMLLDHARTAPPLFGSPPPPPITCDMLKTFNIPTLVTHGEKTHTYYKLINAGVGRCIPRARQVAFPNLVHDAPSRDPAAFVEALFEFLSKR
jgi:pimeloyl-ACP methyl ester carboxylesterase